MNTTLICIIRRQDEKKIPFKLFFKTASFPQRYIHINSYTKWLAFFTSLTSHESKSSLESAVHESKSSLESAVHESKSSLESAVHESKSSLESAVHESKSSLESAVHESKSSLESAVHESKSSPKSLFMRLKCDSSPSRRLEFPSLPISVKAYKMHKLSKWNILTH